MHTFIKTIQIRWADIDPNFHVLHSKYYDFAAYSRMAFLTENGLTTDLMKAHHIGPILFREECIYKRELSFGDAAFISLSLSKCNKDCSRWTMQHELWKDSDTLAAIMIAEGAWMDTVKRKLTLPPELVTAIFESAPKTNNFEWTENNSGGKKT